MQPATVVLVLVLFCATFANAFFSYQSRIPNGANVVRNGVAWPGVGHESKGGGGSRNVFGTAFAGASHSWTTTLCQADSDGDGFTNGQELGDPDCSWTSGGTPSRTSDISHPGYADSTPSTPSPPTTAVPPTTPLPAGATAEPPTPVPPIPATPTPDAARQRTTATTLLTSATSTPSVVDGYLIDVDTFNSQEGAAGGNKYRTNPGTYTIQEGINAVNAGRMFTLLVPFSYSGVYLGNETDVMYRPYYNLTLAANPVIALHLGEWPTTHRNHGHLRVHLQGTVFANSSFVLSGGASLTENIWTGTITVEGYLTDILCVDLVIAFDGANMITEPEKHTKHCAVIAKCIPGGYTVLTHTKGQTSYGPMYNMTSNGNTKSLAWLRTLPERQNDLLVKATGYLNSRREFELDTIDGPAPILALWVIILLAAIGLVVVIVAIVLVCCFMRKSKGRKGEGQDDDEGAHSVPLTPKRDNQKGDSVLRPARVTSPLADI